MSDDIVDRLRHLSMHEGDNPLSAAMYEAADEIERLRWKLVEDVHERFYLEGQYALIDALRRELDSRDMRIKRPGKSDDQVPTASRD